MPSVHGIHTGVVYVVWCCCTGIEVRAPSVHGLHTGVVYAVWCFCTGIAQLQPARRRSWSRVGSEWYRWRWSSWSRWIHRSMLLCSAVVTRNVKIVFSETLLYNNLHNMIFHYCSLHGDGVCSAVEDSSIFFLIWRHYLRRSARSWRQ